MTHPERQPLRLAPEYRPYVWGGHRLRPGPGPTAEAWVVYEHDVVLDGPFAGQTLAQVTEQLGSALLGRRVEGAKRFPLLIKLLDCAAWLSVQVHPDDEMARRLEGPGQVGKTEAWHVLDAAPGAEILCGLRPSTTRTQMEQAIRGGGLLDLLERIPMRCGDTVLLPAGMIHALGPGLLVYEIQQSSDLTYRVYDWDRPASQGRALHIEQSLLAANPGLTGQALPTPPVADGGRAGLASCPYFTLELLAGQARTIELDTRGESFHTLTVIEGTMVVEGDGWRVGLACYESTVIPAACGAYSVVPQGACRALAARVG